MDHQRPRPQRFRRFLSGLLLTVGLLGASAAWAALTLQRTVFDLSRSERLASALLDDEDLEAALVRRSAGALAEALPPSMAAEIPTAELETVARRALASPQADAALREALVGTHRYLVGDAPAPAELDSPAVDEALRAHLAALEPGLAEVVPRLPALEVELPAAGVSTIRSVRDAVERLTGVATLVAVLGLGGALTVAADRARVLRRVGWWAVAAGGVWGVLAFGLPALAQTLLPGGAAVVAALVDVVAGGMVVAGVVLAGAGVAALVGSVALGRPGAWDRRGGRRPVRAGDRRLVDAPNRPPVRAADHALVPAADHPFVRPPDRRGDRPPTSRARSRPRRPSGDDTSPGGSAPRSPQPTRRLPVVPSPGPRPAHPSEPLTERLPAAGTVSDAAPPLAAPVRAVRDDRPWGLAAHPEDPLPDAARWVEGVGYVDPATGGEAHGPANRA